MQPVIRTEGLTKRYGSALALDGLDVSVRAGEAYGYLGPNGAGVVRAEMAAGTVA